MLESLFDNPRTIVSGVAGAGKTLIAMEQARRAYWEGKSVLYLCFNHNIAQYVQYQFEKDNVCIEAVTLHAFMMRACGIDWSPDLNRDFYETELPVAFMAAEDVPVYDLVIIDEGQDLLTDTYLECIDRIVQDGLGDGTWAIYYDPNQNIFNSYVDLPENLRTHQNTASFLDRFKVVAGNLPYAQTIVAHIARDGHYFIHPDIEQNRSITPREAARIQTFPDNYCFESKKGTPSRTLAFKQIGNAVPVCLAYHIALSLLARFADQN